MYNVKIIITNQNSVKNTTAEFFPQCESLQYFLQYFHILQYFLQYLKNFAILFAMFPYFAIIFAILETFTISFAIIGDFAILIAILCDVAIPKYCNTLQSIAIQYYWSTPDCGWIKNGRLKGEGMEEVIKEIRGIYWLWFLDNDRWMKFSIILTAFFILS